MPTLSGSAVLSNGSPANEVIALRLLSGTLLRMAPDASGNYSMLGARAGDWLVSALGPAGYRPQSHLVTVTGAPEATEIMTGLQAWWDFENNRNNRVLTNPATWGGTFSYQPGSFTGRFAERNTGYASVNPLPSGIPGNVTDFTLFCVFKHNGAANIPGDFLWAMTNGNGGNNESFYINLPEAAAGTFRLAFARKLASTGAFETYNLPTGSFTVGQYYRMCLTYNGGVLKVFVGGALIGSATFAAGAIMGFNQFVMGYNFGNSGGLWDRDELAFKSSAISDAAAIWITNSDITYDDLLLEAGT